jgi:hypothetical protein
VAATPECPPEVEAGMTGAPEYPAMTISPASADPSLGGSSSPHRGRSAGRRRLALALGAFLLTGVAVLAAVSLLSDGRFGPFGPGKVLWVGDAETGDLSQWASSVKVGDDRIRTVSSPVRQGSYSYRFEVRHGDNPVPEFSSDDRAELGQANPGRGPLIQDGMEQWYGLSVMFDESFPDASWQTIAQWKQIGPNPPPAELTADDGVLAFQMGGAEKDLPGRGGILFKTPLERGEWHDFVMHVKWSPSPGVGFVELWHDGAKVVSKTPTANMYRDSEGKVIPNHARIGYYRDRAIGETGVVYIDGYKVGTGKGSVSP